MAQEKTEIKGRIDDEFILTRLDRESGNLWEINWGYVGDRGDSNKVVAIWLGFKTIQGDKPEAPKKITFVDFREPKVIPATNLTIIIPRQEIAARLPYECYGAPGTGWSKEIFPGRVLHREEGEATFGDMGFQIYQCLREFVPKVNGFQAIVVLEDIIIKEAQVSYHRPFDDTPGAMLSFTVYRQSD